MGLLQIHTGPAIYKELWFFAYLKGLITSYVPKFCMIDVDIIVMNDILQRILKWWEMSQDNGYLI